MDFKNAGIFSPIRNSDEEKNKRNTGSISEFLKGPDAFKKISTELKENVHEETLSVENILSKTVQDKSTKSEFISPLSSTQGDSFVSCPGLDNSWEKVDKSDNLQSTKKKDLSSTFVTARYEETTNQQNVAECRTQSKHASNTNYLQLHLVDGAVAVFEATKTKEIKNTNEPSSLTQCQQLSQICSDERSVQPGTAVISEASGSKEVKKTNRPSSLNQREPLSQIQSRIEKMVSDALESQVEGLHQLMWSHHYNLLKALYETKETLEHRHELETETLCKLMEELAEENRQLRNAAFNQ